MLSAIKNVTKASSRGLQHRVPAALCGMSLICYTLFNNAPTMLLHFLEPSLPVGKNTPKVINKCLEGLGIEEPDKNVTLYRAPHQNIALYGLRTHLLILPRAYLAPASLPLKSMYELSENSKYGDLTVKDINASVNGNRDKIIEEEGVLVTTQAEQQMLLYETSVRMKLRESARIAFITCLLFITPYMVGALTRRPMYFAAVTPCTVMGYLFGYRQTEMRVMEDAYKEHPDMAGIKKRLMESELLLAAKKRKDDFYRAFYTLPSGESYHALGFSADKIISTLGNWISQVDRNPVEPVAVESPTA